MLDSTPLHLAYSRPTPRAEMVNTRVDVSADKTDDVVEINFRVDLSHLLILNLILNLVLLIVVIRK
jgi:hypothetical protein